MNGLTMAITAVERELVYVKSAGVLSEIFTEIPMRSRYLSPEEIKGLLVDEIGK
jgi:hypothetical protein